MNKHNLTRSDVALLRSRNTPRDQAILESRMVEPVALSVKTDSRIYNRRKKAQGGDHKSKDQVEPLISTAETVADELGTSAPTTFADRIASSPQLVSATITRAIRLKAHRERLAALKPRMAVRMAGSK
jgi:hypothetical protein